jgi:hypothetical protein
MTLDDYLRLITTQHREAPRFIATLSAAVGGALQAGASLEALLAAFDIDSAVGVQLDIIGVWVGRDRNIATPLEDVYFTWDDTDATGWDSGVWRGEFDPDTGLTSLPDDSYRVLLKAKIAANHWDGTIPGAYDVWSSAFGDELVIFITDNQDMTMTVTVVTQGLSAVTKALLTGGYIPLKPAGVRVNYEISDGFGPVFAWDTDPETSLLAGWDNGSWSTAL